MGNEQSEPAGGKEGESDTIQGSQRRVHSPPHDRPELATPRSHPREEQGVEHVLTPKGVGASDTIQGSQRQEHSPPHDRPELATPRSPPQAEQGVEHVLTPKGIGASDTIQGSQRQEHSPPHDRPELATPRSPPQAEQGVEHLLTPEVTEHIILTPDSVPDLPQTPQQGTEHILIPDSVPILPQTPPVNSTAETPLRANSKRQSTPKSHVELGKEVNINEHSATLLDLLNPASFSSDNSPPLQPQLPFSSSPLQKSSSKISYNSISSVDEDESLTSLASKEEQLPDDEKSTASENESAHPAVVLDNDEDGIVIISGEEKERPEKGVESLQTFFDTPKKQPSKEVNKDNTLHPLSNSLPSLSFGSVKQSPTGSEKSTPKPTRKSSSFLDLFQMGSSSEKKSFTSSPSTSNMLKVKRSPIDQVYQQMMESGALGDEPKD
eukprot:scaffold55889_cov46-Attheya_sp.AAC.1